LHIYHYHNYQRYIGIIPHVDLVAVPELQWLVLVYPYEEHCAFKGHYVKKCTGPQSDGETTRFSSLSPFLNFISTLERLFATACPPGKGIQVL
jgi:hypothetical protein